MDVRRVLDRQSRMEAQRGQFETLWEEVARRVFPRGNDFRQKYAAGQSRTEHQYDAFPMMALNRFAAAIEGGLTPRTATWHRLSTGDATLDEDVEVRRYLESLNLMLWRQRYAAQSNFASQAHECYLSAGAFGTFGMLVEARPKGGVRYKSIHLSELFIAENSDGVVDTVHRRFEMTARQAVQEFGEKAPARCKKSFEAGKLEDVFEFIHVVMPREDYDPSRLDDAGKRYTDLYVFADGKESIDRGGFYEMPYLVGRYVTSSREIYGRGPAIMLLPDIKMLNEMRYTVIEAANMAIDPPTLLFDDGLLSEFRLEPGARNYGGVDDQGRQLAVPFQSGARVDIGLDLIQDVKSQIDDGFLGVYFRVLLENPQMTATQALLIAQQQGQMTAPMVGRLQSEFLGPLLRRESGILFRQGRVPPVPQKLLEHMQATGEPLEIEYESPLTRAARSEEAVAVLRSFEALAPMAQVDPTAYRRFNVSEISQLVCDVNGVPARALYSDDEMAAQEEQDAERQALGAVLEAAPIAASTAKTLAEAQRMSGNNPA